MTTKEFYEYHIELLAKGDVNELVNHDYHEEAEMMLHVMDKPIHLVGKEAIRQQLDDYLKNIYKRFISTEKLLCTDDSIYLEATIDTALGQSKVYDALYLRDGKIYRHYSGLKAAGEEAYQEDPSIYKTTKGDIIIHTFLTPEIDEFVCSHIIETANTIIIVDVPLLLTYGEKLREYVDALGKPIDSILITHEHPDHWASLDHFRDCQIYALQGTIDNISTNQELLLAYHRQNHGAERITVDPVIPSNAIQEGELIIDGLRLNIINANNAEAMFAFAVELPAQKTLIAQDLIYNGLHLFVGNFDMTANPTFDNWIHLLQELETKNYETVLAGHGQPTDSSVFKQSIAYIAKAKEAFAAAKTKDDFQNELLAAFPDLKYPGFVFFSGYFLYDLRQQIIQEYFSKKS